MQRGYYKFSKFRNQSESYCEDTLGNLQELYDSDSITKILFDRHLELVHGSLVDASLDNLPRVKTSRSLNNQSSGKCHMSIREVKLSLDESAIDALTYDNTIDEEAEAANTEKVKQQLDEFLKLNDI